MLTIRGDGPYRVNDGIGGMSSGGTSRLLLDYPEAQRSDILDMLFKPQFGMSSQILKLEIGGDVQSTDGTEAAFKHYREEPAQCGVNRGYESWLLSEALKRNPTIKSYVLSWGMPNWVGNATFLSPEGVQFHVDYALCLQALFGGGHPHFMGIWNEKGWSNDYIVSLHAGLVGAGLSTKVVAPDGPDCGPADEPVTNATLASSLYAIGQHYACHDEGHGCPLAENAGLKYWVSEDFSVDGRTFDGAAYWGSRLSLNWVLLNATATISWALIWSAYPTSPFGYAGCGLMSAYSPWTGNYQVDDSVWMTAHHTQFIFPGWHLLLSEGNSSTGSSGVFPGGGSYMSARSPDGSGFSMVFETLQPENAGYCGSWAPTSAQNITVTLAPGTGLPGPGSRLQVWQTVEGAAFVNLPEIVVSPNSTFSLSLPRQAKVTVSTVLTARKGANSSLIPLDAPFIIPYSDNFDDYQYDNLPRFFADNGGSFAVRHGVLQQVSQGDPLGNGWGGTPVAVTWIGGTGFKNASVSVSVSFNSGPADLGDHSPISPASPPPVDAPYTLAKVGPCDPPSSVRPEQIWDIGKVADQYLSCNATWPPVCLRAPRCDFDESYVFSTCNATGPSECGLGLSTWGHVREEFCWQFTSQGDCQHKLLTRTADGECVTADTRDGTLYSVQCDHPDGPGVLWQYNATGTRQVTVTNPSGDNSSSALLCLTAPSVPPPASHVAYAGVILRGIYQFFLRSDGTYSVRVRSGPFLSRGTLPSGFNSTLWHVIEFSALGEILTASVDGAQVWQGINELSSEGPIALRSGYHYAAFDNFSISPL